VTPISRRSYHAEAIAHSWEEIFEAGPYYQRLSEVLEEAQHFALFAGWQIDSRLPFAKTRAIESPEAATETLKEKILRLVESKPELQFYFLIWDHAYFYVLERENWQGRVWDDLHPRIHFLFDNRHTFGASHHEKVCIVDGTTAFCGGIDLCDERWDSPEHLYTDSRRSLDKTCDRYGPYHDIAVQVTGPVCADIHLHLRERWQELSRIPFPPPVQTQPLQLIGATPPSQHLVYVSRTLTHLDCGPRTSQNLMVREIEFLFRDLIASAEKRILLEGQYYWSEEINDMLIAKILEVGSEGRGKDFEIIIILTDIRKLKSLTWHMSIFELKLLEKLQTAASLAGVKLTVGNPAAHAPGKPAKSIYIHSKVLVIDDRFLSIGSANFATRALRLDTEINLTYEARTEGERRHIREFSERVLTHWNLKPKKSALSHIHFHSIRAADQIKHWEKTTSFFQKWIQNRIPWKFLFDPTHPWLFSIERKLRRLSHSRSWRSVVFTGGLWLFSSLTAFGIARLLAPAPANFWYAALLSSVWFTPVPFLIASVLAVYQLGFESGAALSISSLWMAALMGYTLARLFPSYLNRFYEPAKPNRLAQRLGLRQFAGVVSVSFDPRISLRKKIAYHGLYCIPFPWFIMTMLLVLPGAVYILLRICNEIFKALL
jgi:phosphatidylserine/phosphatidylglycerophosphate/cardiolipin synthase-like enzyme